MARVLVAGCGYVGSWLASCLASDGHSVWALSRSGRRPPGAESLRADLTRPDTLSALPARLDHVFYTAGADAPDETAYRRAYVDGPRNLLEALRTREHSPARFFFTSSTAVYGQTAGEWVTETSPTEPPTFRGRVLLEGEACALAVAPSATVLRLGGIYGPGRTSLVERVRRGEISVAARPPVYTNRIHRDDAAGALRHLMSIERPRDLYIGVDDDPAALHEVVAWLAKELRVPLPSAATGVPSGRARGGGKRCRNARLLSSGFRLAFSTYRDGYTHLLADSSE